MGRKTKRRSGVIRVSWRNPPGSRQRLSVERTVRGRTYSREVGPTGFLIPIEAAKALKVSREFVYRLIWDGKLKSMKREGQIVIPLSSIKAYDRRRATRRRPSR